MQRFDGPFEQFAIEVKADGGDLARLFDAEDIAGAADFEIAHGDFHAAAVSAGLGKGVESFADDFGQRSLSGDEEVGVGGAVPAADSSAQLVEIGEAESVGAVDEDGVGIGDVDAVFDDGRGDQNIGLAAFECSGRPGRSHRHASAHGRRRCGLGEQFLDLLRRFEDRFDAVVDDVGLAVAGEFAQQGIFDHLVVALRR